MSNNDLRAALMSYFEENEDDFNDSIEELDSYNSYLGDDRYYSMDELYGLNPVNSQDDFDDLMGRIYYGHDDDDGDGSAFCPNRNYFYYNGYANLVSSDYKDYSDHLDNYFIESLIENYNSLALPDGVEEIFEEYENQDDDSDDGDD